MRTASDTPRHAPSPRCPSWLAALAVAVLLNACATAPSQSSFTPTGDPLADGRSLMERAPKRDRVLWEYRLALTALRRGQTNAARDFLDDALRTVQNTLGPNAEARKSRSQFSAEARKTFIGEPYERTLAYFYRGILYWMDGEPDNARACFRNGLFLDSDSDNRTYAGDYALLEYLDGLITAKLGGDGSDALARSQTTARLAKPEPYYTNWNTFLFVDMGRGPSKYATGEYHEQLRFRAGSSQAARARISVAGQTLYADPWDDVSFQATTRGGRVMDHVLANKAVFKQTTDTVGNAAIIGGAIMASQQGHHSSADEVGAGLLIAGVVSKILSAASTPAADTRTWHNLPHYLGFTATVLPPGDHAITLEFLDAQQRPIPQATRSLTIQVGTEGRDTVVFASDQNQ